MKPSSLLIFLVFIPIFGFAADCPVCPQGGIWSEWSTTETCKITCGACQNLTYTRSCLSEEMNCDCKGANEAIKPCNTQACNYPRANGATPPCCVGTPMIINNWYHCGPLEQKDTSSFCCPAGGIWTEWTIWTKATGKLEYSRTRKCISSGFSCPCVGESIETKFTCPCPPLGLLEVNGSSSYKEERCGTNKSTWDRRGIQYHPEKCASTFLLETSDFMGKFYFLNVAVQEMVTTFVYINATGGCRSQRYKAYEGLGNRTGGMFHPIEFSCDFKSLLWTGVNPNTGGSIGPISEIGQLYEP